jgi:hypothetical protein
LSFDPPPLLLGDLGGGRTSLEDLGDAGAAVTDKTLGLTGECLGDDEDGGDFSLGESGALLSLGEEERGLLSLGVRDLSPLGDTGSEPGAEMEMELTLLILLDLSPR